MPVRATVGAGSSLAASRAAMKTSSPIPQIAWNPPATLAERIGSRGRAGQQGGIGRTGVAAVAEDGHARQ